jgi:hypothetical protein
MKYSETHSNCLVFALLKPKTIIVFFSLSIGGSWRYVVVGKGGGWREASAILLPQGSSHSPIIIKLEP